MKVCSKTYLFMRFKSPYSKKKIMSGKKALGTYHKSFWMDFWDVRESHNIYPILTPNTIHEVILKF